MRSSSKVPLVLATAYDADNPMPEMMSCAVEELGLEVRREPIRKALRRRYSSDARPVIHLHWIGHLFRDRSSFASILKTSKYLALLSAAKLRRFKVVWTLHNHSSHDSRHSNVERVVRTLLIRFFADAIIVMTRQSADDFEASHGSAAARKLRYVPHPTYSSFYGPAPSKDDARQRLGLLPEMPTFLFFGRIRAYKGTLSLIQAFMELSGSMQLVIAGNCGPEDAEILLRMAKSDPRIHLLLERVPDDDVASLVAACDWMVLPYEEVMNSGVLLLALSYARPVIAPDAPTLVEVLGSSLAQACYRRGDDASLEQALRDAAANHESQATWESRAEARASDFDIQTCAKRLADVYRGVVSA